MRLGSHVKSVDLERLQLQIEHGSDLDKVGWPERFTESGQRQVCARRDLVGVEFAYRASRNGPQCRCRCPVGGLVVDVADCRRALHRRCPASDCGSHARRRQRHPTRRPCRCGSPEVRQIAVAERRARQTPLWRHRAVCVLAAAIAAKNEHVDGGTSSCMQRHCAAAAQHFIEGMQRR